jgi:hypothetical protein
LGAGQWLILATRRPAIAGARPTQIQDHVSSESNPNLNPNLNFNDQITAADLDPLPPRWGFGWALIHSFVVLLLPKSLI